MSPAVDKLLDKTGGLLIIPSCLNSHPPWVLLRSTPTNQESKYFMTEYENRKHSKTRTENGIYFNNQL